MLNSDNFSNFFKILPAFFKYAIRVCGKYRNYGFHYENDHSVNEKKVKLLYINFELFKIINHMSLFKI